MTEQTHTHSPFHVIEDFISPANCERIVAELGIHEPSKDENGRILKNERIISEVDLIALLQQGIQENGHEIQDRFTGLIRGMDKPHFLQYFEDPKHPAEMHQCENSKLSRKKWVKVKDVDVVCYLWLKDYGSGVPLDPRHEVYGGKLEFPGYNFSLVPQRGTLAIFPAGPHFMTAISPILVGSLELIKFSLKLVNHDDTIWLYQPENFPGNYQDWFV